MFGKQPSAPDPAALRFGPGPVLLVTLHLPAVPPQLLQLPALRDLELTRARGLDPKGPWQPPRIGVPPSCWLLVDALLFLCPKTPPILTS